MGDVGGAFSSVFNSGAPTGAAGGSLAGTYPNPTLGTAITYVSDATILANTADASDTASISIGGGGGTASTRGATLVLAGNEDALTGKISITTGDTATASDAIKLSAGGTLRWQLSGSASNLLASSDAIVGVNTADGSDNRSLALCSASTNSSNRGAYISLVGNEGGGTGSLFAVAGDAATGANAMKFTTGSNTGEIEFVQGGTSRFKVDTNGNICLPNVTTGTTVGAAGTASALPVLPTGYFQLTIGGVAYKIPYYTV